MVTRPVGPSSQGETCFLRNTGGPSGGSLLSGGGIIILCVIRRHFLACEDIAGGSDLSAGGTFFPEIQRPFRWVPDVMWRNHYFARNKEAFPCVRPWTQLSASPRTIHFRWMSFVDHIDHAAPRAPGRWTTVGPRKGTTRSRGRVGSGCPRGGEYEGLLVRPPAPKITGGVGE